MEIDWNLLLPLIILQVGLQIFALISLFKQSLPKEKKIIWVLIIIFLNLLGPIIYFIFGRKGY
ncbi:MAG: PLD nuclease N-terminal domain-containing protein [Anaerovoracaceae bacterium]